MANYNFFKKEYRTEDPRSDESVGIMDGEGEEPAYTTTDKSLKWNAWVVNKNRHTFLFVPIDCNIPLLKPNGHDLEKRCDGMLWMDSLKYIAFIELKDVRRGGMSEAVKQLYNTIELFRKNHYVEDYKIRRAYAANISYPRFHYSMKDEIESFRKLNFVLMPQAEIILP